MFGGRLNGTLPCAENLSMFRKFVDVIAGTGAVFAALHVFIGYMNFDGTVNEETGMAPKFLDEPEYRYYAVLAVFFLLTVVVSKIFSRMSAIAVVPSIATVTYLMLLLDADLLVAGKMTFLLFSIFCFAGYSLLSLYGTGEKGERVYRYVICAVGAFAVGWAIMVYFNALGAEERFASAMKPTQELDGLSAVLKYERLRTLYEAKMADHTRNYIYLACAQLVALGVMFFLDHCRLLVWLTSIAAFAYMIVLVGSESLPYYPMLCVVPMVAMFIGCQILCSIPEKRAASEQASEPCGKEVP